MNLSRRFRHSFLSLAALLLGGFFAVASATAETPPAPPATPPATAQPAPAEPAGEPVPAPTPGPAPLPKPGEPLQPPPVAPKRKEGEGEPTEPATTAPTTPQPASLGTRVTGALSALRGQGAAIQQLAQRDTTIQQQNAELASLRAQVAQRDATIHSLTAERTQIENAMRVLENERLDVAGHLGNLGFPANQLPAAAAIEQIAENSMDALQAQLRAEPNATKRADIAAQMIHLRDSAAHKRKG